MSLTVETAERFSTDPRGDSFPKTGPSKSLRNPSDARSGPSDPRSIRAVSSSYRKSRSRNIYTCQNRSKCVCFSRRVSWLAPYNIIIYRVMTNGVTTSFESRRIESRSVSLFTHIPFFDTRASRGFFLYYCRFVFRVISVIRDLMRAPRTRPFDFPVPPRDVLPRRAAFSAPSARGPGGGFTVCAFVGEAIPYGRMKSKSRENAECRSVFADVFFLWGGETTPLSVKPPPDPGVPLRNGSPRNGTPGTGTCRSRPVASRNPRVFRILLCRTYYNYDN